MFKLISGFKKRRKIVFSEHSYYPDLITEFPVLFDLGGCYGAFTKHFIEKFPKAKVTLIEPNPTNFRQIDIESPNVTLLNQAISIRDGYIDFYEDINSSQNGSILFNYFNGVKHSIKTTNLEKLFHDYNVVDLVKMDIEGAEWEVLLNTSSETLLKIKQLTVEFHDFIDKKDLPKTLACVKRLKGLGYKLDYQSTDHLNGCKYYDCLFYKNK